MWKSTIRPPHGDLLAPSESTPGATIPWCDKQRDKPAPLARAVIVAALCIPILAIVTYVVLKLASAEGAPVRCFFSHGAAALRACQDVIASEWPPDVRAEADYNRGVELQNLGRHAEAVRAYEEAVRLKPDAAAYTNMGIALGKLGRWDDALRAYHAAIKERPEYGDAHYNLGVTLADLRRWPQALEAFREAARLNPADADALYNTGLMLNLLGRHEEAAQAYIAAVRLRPDYASAWGNLGMTAYLLGRYGDSVEAFERARVLTPNYFDGRDTQRKAWEESRQGRSPSLENRRLPATGAVR